MFIYESFVTLILAENVYQIVNRILFNYIINLIYFSGALSESEPTICNESMQIKSKRNKT